MKIIHSHLTRPGSHSIFRTFNFAKSGSGKKWKENKSSYFDKARNKPNWLIENRPIGRISWYTPDLCTILPFDHVYYRWIYFVFEMKTK